MLIDATSNEYKDWLERLVNQEVAKIKEEIPFVPQEELDAFKAGIAVGAYRLSQAIFSEKV